MFLRNIYDDSDKQIFIELAVLVAIVDDRYAGLFGQEMRDSSGLHSIFASTEESNYVSALLEAISADKLASFDDFFFELDIRQKFSPIDAFRGAFKNGEFADLKSYLSGNNSVLSILQTKAKELSADYRNNKALKKEVLDNLLEQNIEFDSNRIAIEMIKKTPIRTQVIKQAIKALLEPFKGCIQREIRKVIFFELIGMAYSDRHFSTEEQNVISAIGNELELDDLTTAELLDAAQRLFGAAEDAFELINE